VQREFEGGGGVRMLAVMGNLFEETKELLAFFLKPVLLSSE